MVDKKVKYRQQVWKDPGYRGSVSLKSGHAPFLVRQYVDLPGSSRIFIFQVLSISLCRHD